MESKKCIAILIGLFLMITFVYIFGSPITGYGIYGFPKINRYIVSCNILGTIMAAIITCQILYYRYFFKPKPKISREAKELKAFMQFFRM